MPTLKLTSLLMILSGFVFSCATSQQVAPVSPLSELPKELPKELMQKFKLEAVPETPPVSESDATSTASANPELAKKKTKATRAKQKGAFVYPHRRPEKESIWLDEKLVYELTYFGVAAGTLTVTVEPFMTMNERKVYHLKGHARSSKFFDMFYRVDDRLESFFDYEGLFSHRFHLTLDESKQTRNGLELYDSEKSQAFYWNRWNHWKKGYTESKEFFPMDRFPQDALSSIYYMRTLPLVLGSKYKFPVVTEGKTWEAELEVVRTEMMDSPMGRIRTLVLRPETRFQGVLKKTGESLFWVTDDDRRILVRLEAKVKIGSVVAQLKEAKLGTPP